jgi:hypothetical protein
MTKQLKLLYILSFSFLGVILAWNTLLSFFGGVGINYVAIAALLFVVLLLTFKHKLWKRAKDVICCLGMLFVLETVSYFVVSFAWDSSDVLKGFITYQNIISIISFLLAAYFVFRFICEITNTKIHFVEVMLGNEKRSLRVKKEKEVSNGSLEAKPNRANFKPNDIETDDENIIIEDLGESEE